MQTQRCLGSNRPQTGLLQSRSLNSRFQPTHRRRPLPPAMVFTGIVQGMAEVVNVDSKDNFSQLRIAFPPGHVDGIKLGASVAINGTCLTVTQLLQQYWILERRNDAYEINNRVQQRRVKVSDCPVKTVGVP
eukprot:1139861-Pelagomonas_calceolata.AAC.3